MLLSIDRALQASGWIFLGFLPVWWVRDGRGRKAHDRGKGHGEELSSGREKCEFESSISYDRIYTPRTG